jgi:hypothetical protein
MKRLIVILGFMAWPAWAQESDAQDIDWEQLRSQATSLRERAVQMRTVADQTRATTERACQDKLLVAGCMEDASQTYQEAERSARSVELEAINIEKRLRRHDYEARLQKRAEKSRDKEIRAAERAEQIRQDEEARHIKNEERAAKAVQRQEKARRE